MPESTTQSTSKATDSPEASKSTESDPTKQGGGPGKTLDKQGGGALHTEQGTTTIASSVVANIAALATQEIPGVQAMGKSLSRTSAQSAPKCP